MALKVYGHYGKPMVVFPAQSGRFYDYENFGMVEAVRGSIDAGKIKLYAVDSIDSQSWANWEAHPADRARRHEDYDHYITQEVFPFIRTQCGGYQGKCLTTGCSMGAYHSANFFFRHPDIFDGVISISGLYQLSLFVGDFMDTHIYFNSPLAVPFQSNRSMVSRSISSKRDHHLLRTGRLGRRNDGRYSRHQPPPGSKRRASLD